MKHWDVKVNQLTLRSWSTLAKSEIFGKRLVTWFVCDSFGAPLWPNKYSNGSSLRNCSQSLSIDLGNVWGIKWNDDVRILLLQTTRHRKSPNRRPNTHELHGLAWKWFFKGFETQNRSNGLKVYRWEGSLNNGCLNHLSGKIVPMKWLLRDLLTSRLRMSKA